MPCQLRLFVCLVLLASPSVALAQRTTATIYGLVEDSSGAPVPRADVRLVNVETGANRATTTGQDGEFSVTFLPPGRYTLEAESAGFKLRREEVRVGSGDQLRHVVRLEVGDLSETVTVAGETPVLQNASPTLTDRVNRAQIEALPQAKRDFTQLLGLQAGARPSAQGVITINGLAASGQSVTVDGVDGAGDVETPSLSMFNAANQINVISQEAVQEVTVSKGVFSAEIARTFSGNINVITRSGTNQFHGSGLYGFRRDELNARNALLPSTSSKPEEKFDQFGGSIGGPIRRDRMFFFVVYEGYRQDSFINLVSDVPTPLLKSQALANTPAFQPLFDLYPEPTEPFAANATVGTFRGTGANTASDDHAVTRLDWRLGPSDLISGRYKRGRPKASTDTVPLANARSYAYLSESGTASWQHTGSTWTSETRWGLNVNDADRIDGFYESSRVPVVNLQGGFQGSAEKLIARGYSWSAEQVIVKAMGRHTLKFGGIYFDRNPRRFDEEVPIFTYPNAAALIANQPTQMRVTFGQPSYVGHAWETGAFVQGDLRVRPDLMVNVGLRYEYFSVYKDESGHFFNPDGLAGATSVPPVFRPADSAYNGDFNNFSPRVGFAYSPGNGKTVIRGGFGIAYAPLNLRNFATSHYLDPDLPFRFTFAAADITALDLRYPTSNEAIANLVLGRQVPRGYNAHDVNVQNPQSRQWTVDVQRELPGRLFVQTGYVGNQGRDITMSHEMNTPDRLTGVRPFPDALQSVIRNSADRSSYHAWQSSLRKQFAAGLQWNASYTWSTSEAIAGGEFWSGGDYYVQDESNPEADLGPIFNHVAHRFTADAVYQLPFGRDGSWHHLIGGWTVAGTLVAESGPPLNVVESSNRLSSRPDTTGVDPYADGSDWLQWLNPAAFALVPINAISGQTIRPGTAGKNFVRGPGLWIVNLSIVKSVALGGGARLELRADGLNALNHVNPVATAASIVTDVRNAAFGRIRQVGDARVVQIGARVTF